MPGTFTFKPIEANLTHNTDILKKMNPYCSVVVGNTRIKGQICKKGGKHPHWNDVLTLPVTNESKILVELMDKDRITHDDIIGSFVLDLNEVQSTGMVSRWYPLTYKNKPAGEILVETSFSGGNLGMNQGLGQGFGVNQGQAYSGQQQYGSEYYSRDQQLGLNQGGIYKEERILTAGQPVIEEVTTTTTTTSQPLIKEEVIVEKTSSLNQGSAFQQEAMLNQSAGYQEGAIIDKTSNLHQHQHTGQIFTEQRQVVEPHTFMKEVEVVETRSALQEIEVMEPVKVLKDVQYTQAVPVRKQIEVAEPQVVMKDIEVIEPRVVTKTIQVVENVPVTRRVEVVELRNTLQEVETVEPQTFTKQVEVTEYVPARKMVEVTQPVTLRKDVEFVEPVITTQTITKELQQPVIVNEEITTTVGPASVIGISSETREVRGSQYMQTGSTYTQQTGSTITQTGSTTTHTGHTTLGEKANLLERKIENKILTEEERLRQGKLGLNQKHGGYPSTHYTTEEQRLRDLENAKYNPTQNY